MRSRTGTAAGGPVGRAAFGHDGPALVDVRTARQELALPPKLTNGQPKGFTLYATTTSLSDGGKNWSSSKTNLRALAAHRLEPDRSSAT
jgi:pyruvate dehydrogenase (quinone)